MTVDSSPSPFAATTGTARYAAFSALAESGPVHRYTMYTGAPAWLVTGYAEVRELLVHPAMAKDDAWSVPFKDVMPADLRAALFTHMLHSNPPNHTRLRKLVTAAFTARRVQALGPRIQEIADELLDQLGPADGSPVDLVAGLGYPLPITVIAELVGVPVDDRDTFLSWSSILVNAAHPAEVYLDAVRDMVGYVRGLVSDKRRAPGDDLLSALIEVHNDGDRLSENELTSMVYLLLVAGHETTANLISGTAYALLSRPELLRLVRAEPDRLAAVVEEQLRHDGPVQIALPLVATAPVTIGGVTIPAGDVVVPALLPADRDPAQFAEPDRFDLDREPTGHLAFGHGIHHCLGAPLARMEVVIAMGSLLRRFPEVRLADPDTEPERFPSPLLNGVTALPVTLG